MDAVCRGCLLLGSGCGKCERCAAQGKELAKELARVRQACAEVENEIQEVLGTALYGPSEEGLASWGEHIGVTLAAEAARKIGELKAELARARQDAAGAAALRQAFNRAAETYPSSVATFLLRTKPGAEQNEALMRWWGELYRAITSTTAGLDLLAQLARLREGKDGG